MPHNMTNPISIRPLVDTDYQSWLPLWTGYLTFYGAQLPDDVTKTAWQRFQDANEPMYALGAFDGETLIGIVHVVRHRATWTKGWYLYLEDLFTIEAARGRGAGRALVQAVYELADDVGAARVYWHTHETNTTARTLYDKVGHNAGFLQYRRPV